MLKLPSVQETPVDWDDWYLVRLGIDRGISLLQRQDGTYYWQRYPSLDELLESKTFYLGGHEYPLSTEEYNSLIAAGFGAYVELYTPPGSFGWGVYGGGQYGYGGEYV